MPKKTLVLVLFIGLAISGVAKSALIDRGGGLIYDDVLNITWLQDANYGAGSSDDNGYSSTDGLMTWANAMSWASNLVYHDSVRNVNYSDWRLPKTLLSDPSCDSHGSSVTAENCTGSELGHLFYKTLENFGASNAPDAFGLVNTGPLINLFEGHGYWSDTEYSPNSIYAYYFLFAGGFQAYSDKSNLHYALAVRPGDVAAPMPVAEPSTIFLLFAAGLGLVAMRSGWKHPMKYLL